MSPLGFLLRDQHVSAKTHYTTIKENKAIARFSWHALFRHKRVIKIVTSHSTIVLSYHLRAPGIKDPSYSFTVQMFSMTEQTPEERSGDSFNLSLAYFEIGSLTKSGICQFNHTGSAVSSRHQSLSRLPHLASRWVLGLTRVLRLGIKLRSSCFGGKDLVTDSSPSLADCIFRLCLIYTVYG